MYNNVGRAFWHFGQGAGSGANLVTAGAGAIQAATQAEAEAGVISNKYISPSTLNPDNYTLLVGDIEPGLDSLLMWSSDDNAVRGVRPETIASLANVPLTANVSYVTKGGNDSTAQVGDRAKPFLTVQGAMNATPDFGYIVVEGGSYNENIVIDKVRITIKLFEASMFGSITNSNGFGTLIVKGDSFNLFRELFQQDVVGFGVIQCNNVNYAGQVSNVIGGCVFTNCVIQSKFGSGPVITDAQTFAGRIHRFYGCRISVTEGFMDFAGTAADVTVDIKDCDIEVRSGATKGLFLNLNNHVSVVCKNGNTIRTELFDVFAGSSDGTSTTELSIDISNCDIDTTGYVFNMSSSKAMNIRALNTNIKCAQTQNINWATPEVNVVNLRSRTNTQKVWDAASLINAVAINDWINPNL